MPNLPLDANDEDILQRGLRRPSIDDVLLPVNETFQAVRAQYDNTAPGFVSTDNIWPMRNAAELSNLSPAERQEFLEQRGLVPPVDSIPYNASTAGIDQLIDSVTTVDSSDITQALSSGASYTSKINSIQDQLDSSLANGANIPTDSYGQSLLGSTTQPTPLTAPPAGGSYNPVGIQSANSVASVYQYTPIDLYDDRYDFATGRVIRKGIATGAKGGVGAEDRPGNTLASTGLAADTQTELTAPPASVSPNDTSPEQFNDEVLRQQSESETSTPPRPDRNNSSLAGRNLRAAQLRWDRQYGSENTSDNPTSTATIPRKTETSPPSVEQASRYEIIRSRRQTTQDIRSARAYGENLVRKRRPDGTYYAAPANSSGESKSLPQSTRNF